MSPSKYIDEDICLGALIGVIILLIGGETIIHSLLSGFAAIVIWAVVVWARDI